jgi:hypothetical protein
LQDALKDSIGSEYTGISDIKGSEKVTLQNKDILAQLKVSDGLARHTMIKHRDTRGKPEKTVETSG